MKYPINEQKFADRLLSSLDDPDEGDRELAITIAQAINRAYIAGVSQGKEDLIK